MLLVRGISKAKRKDIKIRADLLGLKTIPVSGGIIVLSNRECPCEGRNVASDGVSACEHERVLHKFLLGLANSEQTPYVPYYVDIISKKKPEKILNAMENAEDTELDYYEVRYTKEGG